MGRSNEEFQEQRWMGTINVPVAEGGETSSPMAEEGIRSLRERQVVKWSRNTGHDFRMITEHHAQATPLKTSQIQLKKRIILSEVKGTEKDTEMGKD